MPALLLTRGDPRSKDLLRRALEARYGHRPPSLDTLRVEMKGRTRVSRGMFNGWAPVHLTLSLKFPFAVHAQFTGRVLGLPLGSEVEAFDGTTFHRDSKLVDASPETESVRRRLWALNALMLSPLTEATVELRPVDELSFDAVHLPTGLRATITLNESGNVANVSLRAFNPNSGREQIFKVQISNDQIGFGDLILPARIVVLWDDVPSMALSAISATTDVDFDDSLFTLEN